MSIDLFCPKCEAKEYILEENQFNLNGLTGSLSPDLLSTVISANRAVVLTCTSCGLHFKNGDAQNRQQKLTAARLALIATQNGSQHKAALVYGVLGISGGLISYKFFNAHHAIFGYVFSIVAIALLIIAITGFIFTPKKRPIY